MAINDGQIKFWNSCASVARSAMSVASRWHYSPGSRSDIQASSPTVTKTPPLHASQAESQLCSPRSAGPRCVHKCLHGIKGLMFIPGCVAASNCLCESTHAFINSVTDSTKSVRWPEPGLGNCSAWWELNKSTHVPLFYGSAFVLPDLAQHLNENKQATCCQCLINDSTFQKGSAEDRCITSVLLWITDFCLILITDS